jgi:hypothetical protein
VRAAAPQRKHQSCLSASGAPQIGQLSLEATGATAPAPADCAEPPPDTGTPPSAGATLRSPQVAVHRESCLERTSWFLEGWDRRAGSKPDGPDGCTRQRNDAGSNVTQWLALERERFRFCLEASPFGALCICVLPVVVSAQVCGQDEPQSDGRELLVSDGAAGNGLALVRRREEVSKCG